MERMIDPELSPGEALTFGCAVPNFTGNIIGSVGLQRIVRLSIEIRYTPWGTPKERTHTEGFRTEEAADGMLRWIRVEPIPIWRPDYSGR